VKHKYYSKNFKEEKKEFRNKIIIENFPTRAEIYTLLHGFAETNNILFEYTTKNSTNHIEIAFKNTENANGFIELLEKMKSVNPIYSKIKAYFINVDSYNNTLLKPKKNFDPEESFLKNNVKIKYNIEVR